MPIDTLPPELIRKILLYTARASISSCRTLCEVATWVRHLALPLLYNTVSLDERTLGGFTRTITSPSLVCPPNPTFRPGDAMRHLWVSTSSRILDALLQHCKNVTYLALTGYGLRRFSAANYPSRLSFGEEEADLHVTLLKGAPGEWNNLWAMHDASTEFRSHQRLFRRITHLRFEWPLILVWVPGIEYLPRLTHLAIPVSPYGGTERQLNCIFEILAGTSIEVFVLVLMHEHLNEGRHQQIDNWVHQAHMHDARIHAVAPLSMDLHAEWDSEVRGNATIWESAVEYTRLLMSRA